MIKQRTWFFANKTWFGQSRPSPSGGSPTEKWVKRSAGHLRSRGATTGPEPAPFFPSTSQRLVGVHSRKVCRDVIAACSASAGIKSGHSGHFDPIFREVLRKKCTRKKIPEMTIRLPGVPGSKSGFPKSHQHIFRSPLHQESSQTGHVVVLSTIRLLYWNRQTQY